MLTWPVVGPGLLPPPITGRGEDAETDHLELTGGREATAQTLCFSTSLVSCRDAGPIPQCHHGNHLYHLGIPLVANNRKPN